MNAIAEVSLDNEELAKLFDHWIARGGQPRAAMAVVADMLVAAVNDNFETQGHGTWPGLADSTLAQRRGSAAQVLVDTGAMAASISADAGDDWAEASTGVAYAVYHVSDAPRSRIPLRDFFDVGDDVYDDITEYLLEQVSQP